MLQKKGVLSARNASVSIVNGKPAKECEWKWQVLLSMGCGGIIISEDWVLTAAHCLDYDGQTGITVTAGKWLLRQTGNHEQSVTSRAIMHSHYNRNTMDYDFALLQLDTPLTFDSCVGAAPLPAADASDGDSCWITGWGTLRTSGSQPNEMQEAEVEVIGNQRCMQQFSYGSGDITDRMLCAQGRNADGAITDACQGDSGGPLVCKQGGRFVIQGATSWGYGCASADHPGVWARVWDQLDWIQSKTSLTAPAPAPTPPGPAPTPAPSGCVDNSAQASSCSGWANAGYCSHSTWGAWMQQNCCASCQAQPAPSPSQCIADLHGSCPHWADLGYCEHSYVDYMEANCCASCQSH